MGQKITKLRPIDGFCAETAGAISIFFATHAGVPVSTTHVITGAISGVGAAKRLTAVRWGVTLQIVWAWIFTIPGAALTAGAGLLHHQPGWQVHHLKASMRRSFEAFALLAAVISVLAAPGPAAGATRAKDILPAEGLITSSLAALRDQAALNAHYYLADETLLGLGRKTDAVLAHYRTGTGESLLLVIIYPTAEEASRFYGRFGRDFFSDRFDPKSPRVVEKLETGDWAGAALKGRVLVVVLESPDREACDGLLRRAEEKVPAAKAP